jgi:biotin transport system substrate-specific component
MASSDDQQRNNKEPRAVSPTPLRDWVNAQTSGRRAAMVALGALLMACGAKASIAFGLSPVPMTQLTIIALLAGAFLGSELGALSGLGYLLLAATTGVMWPDGAGETPLVGQLAGYLWSVPAVAYLSGYFVERARAERPVYFAIGACAALAFNNVVGPMRLMLAGGSGPAEAVARGASIFVGQHIAQGALSVFIASSASSHLQARRNK